jgi:polyhydroxyalkanoate synthesis regulator phasin
MRRKVWLATSSKQVSEVTDYRDNQARSSNAVAAEREIQRLRKLVIELQEDRKKNGTVRLDSNV